MINKVTLIGNLGKDPDVRMLESGAKVANFSLATNENYQDKSGDWQKVTEWHNIVCWRGLAERAERSLKVGMQVYIEGKITYRKWTDQNGQDRYSTDIVANTLRILEKRENSGNNQSYGNDFQAAQEAFPKAEAKPEPVISQPESTPQTKAEDDLPF